MLGRIPPPPPPPPPHLVADATIPGRRPQDGLNVRDAALDGWGWCGETGSVASGGRRSGCWAWGGGGAARVGWSAPILFFCFSLSMFSPRLPHRKRPGIPAKQGVVVAVHVRVVVGAWSEGREGAAAGGGKGGCTPGSLAGPRFFRFWRPGPAAGRARPGAAWQARGAGGEVTRLLALPRCVFVAGAATEAADRKKKKGEPKK